jgi:hypothetical protein
LRSERVHFLGSGKPGVVDDPETPVLLPGKAPQEVVFWVNVIAECLRAEEGVNIATVGELAEDLDKCI